MNRDSRGDPDDGRRTSGVGKARLAMSAETVLRRVAFGCAIFLLFGMFSDRTSIREGSTIVTDAAGYNLVALFSGIIAIVGLSVALAARPAVVVTALGAVAAIAAFGLTVYESGIYWLARTRGEVFFYGTGEILETPPWGTVHPAAGPPFFAAAAAIGAVATLGLGVIWLRAASRDGSRLPAPGRGSSEPDARSPSGEDPDRESIARPHGKQHIADSGAAPVGLPEESTLHLVAVGCAVILLLAMLLPNWIARTWWSTERRNRGSAIIDSPAGYVGVVSLCGLVALIALLIALWRWRRAAAFVTAGAFAIGGYMIADYWLDLSRGVVGLEGSRNATLGPRESIHWPAALPLFAASTHIGGLATLALMATWLWPTRRR